MLRRIRQTLAVIFFLCITLLFLDFTGTLQTCLGWMAKIQFLPAIMALNVVVVAALVIVTLIFGRIYCSVICPMGVMQDVVSWLHGRVRCNRFSYSPAKSVLRYTVLGVFVVALLAGVSSLVALLAPYSSYGRIVSNLLQPFYLWGNNALAYWAERVDSYAFYSADVWIKGLPTLVVAAVTLVAVAILAWSGGRTYCNTICPVGTMLGLLSRFAWLKVRLDEDKCVQCGLCSRNCKASAIDYKHYKVDYSRCVACGDCIGKCHKDAISYSPRPSQLKVLSPVDEASATSAEATDMSKRAFLLGTAMVAGTVLMAQEKKKVDGGLAVIEEKKSVHRSTRLLPPGAMSAQHFAQHCTACQLCVSECPNGVLRPTTDLLHLMQPEMSYERGYCRPECTRCSDVCPTGAIRRIDRSEKSAIHIGHAVWMRRNCVVLTDDVSCGNCARHCPTGAITMTMVDNLTTKSGRPAIIPVVNEDKCIGCGACEYVCPSRPFSAIYIEGHEQHREV